MREKFLELPEEELQEVLEQARRLEPKAIAKLSQYCYPKAFSYIYYRVNDRSDAEDLTSEVCLRMMQSIQQQKGSFKGWVYRVASNVVTDFYRRRAVRSVVDPVAESVEEIADDRDESTQLLNQEQLKKGLSHLTDEQREVIILKFIEGYETEEIARLLEKSNEAIRALQFRALTTLKRILRTEKQ